MGRKSTLWMFSIPPFFYLIIASMRKDRRTQIEMRVTKIFPSVGEEKQKQSRGIYVCFISIVSLSPSSPSTNFFPALSTLLFFDKYIFCCMLHGWLPTTTSGILLLDGV